MKISLKKLKGSGIRLNRNIKQMARRYHSPFSSFVPEAAIQMQLIQWAFHNEQNYPCLKMLFHSPNGEERKPQVNRLGIRFSAVAQKLKRMGVKPGVPDLLLPYPKGAYLGLALELKSEKGRLQQSQKEWLDNLQKVGWACRVCYSFDEAKKVLSEYCGLAERTII